MATGKVHTGDTNTDFQLLVQDTEVTGVNTIVDLSTASVKQMVFTDPDGNETTVTATALNGSGTDGILRYINTVIPINKTGFWKYRAKLTLTGGSLYQSNDTIFEVL